MKLLYEEKVSKLFKEKVINISKKLGINPNWLMAVINHESGFNPHIPNRRSRATGLIQFIPPVARELGTSIAKLKKMSPEQQVDYVYKYYKGWQKRGLKAKSFIDLYFITFYPAAVGKPLSWVLDSPSAKAKAVGKANPLFDTNHDGVLTVKEVQDYMLKKVPKAWRQALEKGNNNLYSKTKIQSKKNKSLPIIGIVAIIAGGFIVYKIINKNDNKNTKSSK